MSNNPKKHHCLPQFYLRGFANDNGVFTIYDKELKIFRKSKPEHEFYEKHRNTVDIRGEKSLIVESMYSHLESILAPVIVAVKNSKHTDSVLNADLVVKLKFFAEVLRWRNPALDDVYEKIAHRFTLKDFGFALNGIDQETAIGIEKEMIADSSVQKMMRPLIAAFSLNNLSDSEKEMERWRLLYQDGGFPIIGDFPIIFNPKTIKDNNNREFILPLSSDRTVIHAKISSNKQLPNFFTIEKDLAMIHLSRRYVCCKREDYLRFMIEFYYQDYQNIGDDFFENIFSGL